MPNLTELPARFVATAVSKKAKILNNASCPGWPGPLLLQSTWLPSTFPGKVHKQGEPFEKGDTS
jgi:hypothetical protein